MASVRSLDGAPRQEQSHIGFGVGEIGRDRQALLYPWPHAGALDGPRWSRSADGRWLSRAMPESRDELSHDSRWPALFPSSLCLVTTSDGRQAAIEKVVGATIVNRFPYVMALSFCREPLSDRHYPRRSFMDVMQRAGSAAVQFLMPGAALSRALDAIAQVPEEQMAERLARAADRYRTAKGSAAPVLADAYLVYEGRLVKSGRDFEGVPINAEPFTDSGSHRIVYLEITRISLADEIASGSRPLHWRSLPTWRKGWWDGQPDDTLPIRNEAAASRRREISARVGYTKSYQPDYVFPSRDTIAFAGTPDGNGYSVLEVPPLAEDQVEVDNDRARWPCFFPSSLGVISITDTSGHRTAFPCGSTSILSRSPLTVAICVSYARINARYAPRASLDVLRRAGRFGCGVPLYRPDVLEAIGYLGNVSLRDDPDKVANCGLTAIQHGSTFGFAELPVHFDCRIVDEVRLGTHAMFLGQVERISVDSRLGGAARLDWCPWAGRFASESA